LNKSQIEEQCELRHILTPFHLNETARFVQNGVVPYTVKKKAQNDVVLNGTIAFLLPLDAQKIGEKESFVPLFSPMFILSLSLLNIKKTPTIATYINSYPWPTTGR
jgi:hypothetical protein